jgi:epoxyqueuosine reductase
MTLVEKSQRIKELAIAAGFEACGIAKAAPLIHDSIHLDAWLAAGFQAGMKYMENHYDLRLDPTKLVEGAKSVIVVLQNYYPSTYPFENSKYKISRYALGYDYHDVVKKKLHQLYNDINNEVCEIKGRAFVDSAPVMERAWARQAGLGWIGKNSLLLNKQFGSYFFIAELIVDIELHYDEPLEAEYCGECKKCLDACPTRAIVRPKIIDSNKCISYNTIENKEPSIPEYIQPNLKGRIFGCDICQEVCPWNAKIKPHKTPEFEPNQLLKNITDQQFENISETEFDSIFAKSPVKRAKFNGLKRNIQACKG